MSHVEAGIYRGPRPDCIYCKGTGIRKVRRAHEEGWDVVSERCACTDPRPQGRARAGRTPQGSEEKQGAERLRRKKTREREKRMSETQKDNRTKEWAERVGREAVELGFPAQTRMHFIDEDGDCGVSGDEFRLGWGGICWPDFRDRLTELACIAWVEDVAREVYGMADVHTSRLHDGVALVSVEPFRATASDARPRVRKSRPTLAEACIAAVRAMKGGE